MNLGNNFESYNYVHYYQIEEFVKSVSTTNSSKFIISEDLFKKKKHYIKRIILPEELQIGKSSYNFLVKFLLLLSETHHNLKLQIKQYFTFRNDLYLIMEYLENYTDLESYLIINVLLNEKKCKQLMTQLIDILRFCHNKKVFHLNINPKNIIFVDDLCSKIKVN